MPPPRFHFGKPFLVASLVGALAAGIAYVRSRAGAVPVPPETAHAPIAPDPRLTPPSPEPAHEATPARDAASKHADTAADARDRRLLAALQTAAPEQRRRLLRSLAEQLADANDGLTAADYLAAMRGPDDQAAQRDAFIFTRAFVDRLARHDSRAAIAWAAPLPGALKEIAYGSIARQCATRDLDALTAWTFTLESAALRATVIRTTAQELRSRHDAAGAAHWAATVAQSSDGARFSELVAFHWARVDFAAAARWADALPDQVARENAHLAIVDVTAEANPSAALSWSNTLPDEALRLRALQRTLTVWANTDPAAAAAWCDLENSPRSVVASAAPGIASAWMQRDPTAAAQWLSRATLPPETKAYLLTLANARTSPR